MDRTKITVYATPDPENGNAAYIAGPISIIATADNFADIETPSAELISLIESSGEDHPVVFVKNVFPRSETSTNVELKMRGAYYMLVQLVKGKDSTSATWQEVMIGPTIENTSTVEAISSLDVVDKSGFVKLTGDKAGEVTGEIVPLKEIPEFPEYIKEQSKYYQENVDYEVPDDVRYHLDAALDKLGVVGDITSPEHIYDVDGSCQELYDLLYAAGTKVINVEKQETGLIAFVIGEEKKQVVYLKDTNVDATHLPVDPTNPFYYAFNFDGRIAPGYARMPEDIYYNSETDIVLVSMKDVSKPDATETFISPLRYNVLYDNKEKLLTIQLAKSFVDSQYANAENLLLTIVIIKKYQDAAVSLPEIVEQMEKPDTGMTLSYLKTLMYKLYLLNKTDHIIDVQNVYLSNDAKGNMTWVNNFVPETNYFAYKNVIQYADCKELESDPETVRIDLGEAAIPEKFLNTFIFFDNLYVSDGVITFDDTHAYLDIKKGIYWSPREELVVSESEKKDTFTLDILFVTKAADDIINRLTSNYLTKRDAVNILSRGTLDLDNYPTFDDISHYSKIGHSHSSYASVTHTHDFRYAAANHIHGDMITKATLQETLKDLNLTGHPMITYEKVYEVLLQDEIQSLGRVPDIPASSNVLERIPNATYYHYLNSGDAEPVILGADEPYNLLLKIDDSAEVESGKYTFKNTSTTSIWIYEFKTNENLYKVYPIAGGQFYRFDNVTSYTIPVVETTEEDGTVTKSVDLTKLDLHDKYKLVTEETSEYLTQWEVADVEAEFQKGETEIDFYNKNKTGELWELNNNLFFAVRSIIEIPEDALTPTAEEVSSEIANVVDKKVKAAFLDMGIQFDDEGNIVSHVARFDSDQVDIKDDILKSQLTDDLTTEVDPTLTDVLSGLVNKTKTLSEPIKFVNVPDSVETDVGGLSKGTVLPKNLDAFITALVSDKSISEKGIPAKVSATFYYKDSEHSYRNVTAIEATNRNDLYCKIEILDKYGDHVRTHAYSLTCKVDDGEKITLQNMDNINGYYLYNLSEKGFFKNDNSLYKLTFYATSTSLEFAFTDMPSDEYVLEVKYPRFIFTSTSQDVTEFGWSAFKDPNDYNLSYDASGEATHNLHSNKYFVLGINADADFKVYDAVYEENITPAFLELHDLQLTINNKEIAYNMYALPTLDGNFIYETTYVIKTEEK